MKSFYPCLLAPVALASLAVGCQGAAPVVPATSSASADATVSPAPGPTPVPTATPSATPTPAPAGFRDDFNGSALDASRWLSFPQTGIVRVADGMLDVLNTPTQRNFPYVVTHDAVVPAEGPVFMELAYRYVTLGTNISFNWDFLPAELPNEKALTVPFMATNFVYTNMVLNFDTETGAATFQSAKAVAPSDAFHRLRLEFDGKDAWRVILDTTELGKFTSRRRPRKFWIGQNPPKDLTTGASWPRIQLDYVAAGPLTSPDPARPAPTPAPTPVPTATPTPKP